MTQTENNKSQKQIKSEKSSDPLRYSGPIQLITTPIIWWSGLGFTAVAILVLWSIMGRIPQISQGVGAFSYPFRIVNVPVDSSSNGAVIKSVNVEPGSFVKKDQIIAVITQPTSYLKVEEAKSQLELAKSKLVTAENSYRSLIGSTEKQAAAYLALTQTGQELLKSGVISKTTYLQTAGSYNQQLGSAQSYKNNIINARQEVTSSLIQYKSAIDNYKALSIIKAPNNGLVLQINYKSGDSVGSEGIGSILDISGYTRESVPKSLSLILASVREDYLKFSRNSYENKGEKILRPRSEPLPLYFIAYFDQNDGGKVSRGMEARILPNNIQQNTVGALRGIVKGVFPLPVGQVESTAVLGSSSLSQSLLSNSSKSYVQVVISLLPNTSFKSGYEWVGGNGPQINTLIPRVGDTASVNIITQEKPPITVALPSLRQLFGLPMGM